MDRSHLRQHVQREERGAHPAEHLQPLTLERVKQVLGDFVVKTGPTAGGSDDG